MSTGPGDGAAGVGGSAARGAASDAIDRPVPHVSARTGWVVAAFLLFWPLAVPALVQAVRAARNAASADLDAARRASRRALGFAVAAICTGTLLLAGSATAVAMAPAWLPDGVRQDLGSAVLPVLAEAAGVETAPPEVSAGAGATAGVIGPSGTPGALPGGTGSPLPLPGGSAGAVPSPGPTGSDVAEWWATEGQEFTDDPARTKPVNLDVGDCLDTEQVEGVATLFWIPVVPCGDPHGGEVFGTTRLADSIGAGDTPTQAELWKAADSYCYPAFEDFVGTPWASSELVYWPVAPSEESWREGDRKVACIVESKDEAVTGTLKSAER
ncbi:septum formation family protein [Myceligenerans crystallogenes]|uniref:septum formation family protein n=1 Tax=Myceligenerans crystallogenes TaxID=316335 RepID=UPI0031DF29EC